MTYNVGDAISFVLGDDPGENFGSTPIQVNVTLTQISSGTVEVKLSTLDAYTADLFGFFFNVDDDALLGTLSFSDGVVPLSSEQDTDAKAGAGTSQTNEVLANGNNLNGNSGETSPPFEVGVQFGAPGRGVDGGFRDVTFTISASGGFTLDQIVGQLIGLRAQSSGLAGDDEGSSKLITTVPEIVPGKLVVTKYKDANGDGDLDDASDGKLGAGWTFAVDLNGDGDHLDAGETQTTGADGTATFTGLTIGQTYKVVELLGESTAAAAGNGWYQTVGKDGFDRSVAASGGTAYADFGNTEYGKLVVTKYKDLNGDGDLYDAGENILFAGFSFKLTDLTTSTSVVVTDGLTGTNPDGTADGKVTFSGLIVGHDYKVEEVLPTGSPYFVSYSSNTSFKIDSSGESETAVFGNSRFEGLTPGYWKNLGYTSGDWGNQKTGYAPYSGGTLFESIFGDIGTFKSGKANINGDTLTLFQALGLEGGGKAALARHGVAALLNSIEEDLTFYYTQAKVIEIVKDALGAIASPNDYVGDAGIELAKNDLAAQNELELFG
jgi:hypothetical protein